MILNQFDRTCRKLSVIKPSNNLSHISTWVFTLTATQLECTCSCVLPGPETSLRILALVLTYCCCSIVLPLKSWLDLAKHLSMETCQFTPKSQLLRIASTSSKIVGCTLSPSLQEVFEQTLVRQAQKICSDATEVLHSECQLLPSGKRYRIPKCKRSRYISTLSFHSRSKN